MEFLGHLHQTQGLAVAFRIGHAEVAVLSALGVAALLLANEHHGLAVHIAQAAHHGVVVPAGAVAVKFEEVAADGVDVIQGVGPVGVAAQLHPLPACQIAVDALLELLNFGLQLSYGAGHVHAILRGQCRHLGQPAFQLDNRFFEFQSHGRTRVGQLREVRACKLRQCTG